MVFTLAMKVGVHVWVEEEIWQKFKEYVMKKYGKLHGALGDELGMALLHYLQQDTHTSDDGEQYVEDMHSPEPIPDKRDYNASSKVIEDIPKILGVMRQYVDVGGRLSKKVLHVIIAKATSKFDERSLDSRILAMVAFDIIEPDFKTSPRGNVYIVKKTTFSIDGRRRTTNHTGRLRPGRR